MIVMKKNYYEMEVSSKNASELFKNFSFELGVDAIEEKENSFIIRDEEDLQNLEFAFMEFQKALQKKFNTKIDLQISKSIKENADWIEKYQKSIEPIEVGKFYVRPSWKESKKELIDIIIDPAIAFGSGHHESTNMCLKLIDKYAKDGATALDVGCGSGILSIALKKIGLKVAACDTDIQAVDASIKNAQKNGVKIDKIWNGSIVNANLALRNMDGEILSENLNENKNFNQSFNKEFDFVIANIITDVILILQNELKNSVKSGGILIISGILEKYKNKILNVFSDMNNLEILQNGEWVSFVFKKG